MKKTKSKKKHDMWPAVEVDLCEYVDGSFAGKGEASVYYVEIRFIPTKGAHTTTFRGTRHKDKAVAMRELEQARDLVMATWPLEMVEP